MTARHGHFDDADDDALETDSGNADLHDIVVNSNSTKHHSD